MYYVTMTDKFLSNWGRAEGKIAKFIYVCKDFEEAKTVADNAKFRGDQKNINICSKKPYYNENKYVTQICSIEDCQNWYYKDFFKNKKSNTGNVISIHSN